MTHRSSLTESVNFIPILELHFYLTLPPALEPHFIGSLKTVRNALLLIPYRLGEVSRLSENMLTMTLTSQPQLSLGVRNISELFPGFEVVTLQFFTGHNLFYPLLRCYALKLSCRLSWAVQEVRYERALENGTLFVCFKTHGTNHSTCQLVHSRLQLRTVKHSLFSSSDGYGIEPTFRMALDRLEREALKSTVQCPPEFSKKYMRQVSLEFLILLHNSS